jgi:hypothetical protein
MSSRRRNGATKLLSIERKKMEVTGYQIREALNRYEARAKTAEQQFKDTLFAFEGDRNTISPKSVVTNYSEAQEAICALQVLRAKFNLETQVSVSGYSQPIPLALAVKLIGPADRVAKMWREATTYNGRDRWSMGSTLSRDKDSEYAQRTISVEEATKLADVASSNATALRSAIAEGNARKIKIGEGTDFPNIPKLFE